MSNDTFDNREIILGFIEECQELLTNLERALLELEQYHLKGDLIQEIFRILHTIKGNGAIFGFSIISEFTHKVESVYSLVRENKLQISKHLIDITLEVKDIINAMLEYNKESLEEKGYSEDIQKRMDSVLKQFHNLVDTVPALDDAGDSADEPDVITERTFWIRFKPPLDIYLRGMDPEKLVRDLDDLGFSQVFKHLVPDSDKKAREDEDLCTFFWDIILTTEKERDAIDEVFIFASVISDITIKVIDDSGEHYSETEYKRIGEILLERGDLNKDDLELILEKQKKIGETLIDSDKISKDTLESALAEQEYIREMRRKRQDAENSSSVRIRSDKLDILVNLVGELVTNQARIAQISSQSSDTDLTAVAEQLEHLTNELRDVTMHMRMLPLGMTFGKFKRLVRDLSSDLGKDIELITKGGDTELDKSVIEKLNEPLVHLIRNSIDHGIESPEERQSKGKRETAAITLSASQSGPNVLITIEDNGRGIDPEKVLEKAIHKGIVPKGVRLGQKDILNLIFAPGFSTADKVSELSGRGVGMDVVKKTVDNLGGSIELSSSIGHGTVITMILPLTLAIIEGLLVTIGSDKYVFPLSTVEECIELTDDKKDVKGGRHIINLRGEALPYISLRDRFGINQDFECRNGLKEIVITNWQDTKIGFVVDEVIGNIQTVIKSLGRLYAHVEGFSGATILGDGSVAIILDVNALTRQAVAVENH